MKTVNGPIFVALLALGMLTLYTALEYFAARARRRREAEWRKLLQAIASRPLRNAERRPSYHIYRGHVVPRPPFFVDERHDGSNSSDRRTP